MYRSEIYRLDRSIGLYSIGEIVNNIKDNGVWVNAIDGIGDTPLHVAARNKEILFIHAMLPYFTRVNTANKHGDTVLHIFIDKCMKDKIGYKEKSTGAISTLISNSTYLSKKHRIIRSLLSKGADINAKNKHGITPAQLAAKHAYADVLKIFESSKQHLCVRVNSDDNLLHLVCKNTKSKYKDTNMEKKAMRYLVKRGCDVNAIDDEGYSSLHYALQTRSIETVKKLFNLGLDVRRWNKKSVSKHLLTASVICNTSVIQFLIEQGANVNVKNASGMTPLHLVSSRNLQQYEAMEVLLKSGAHIDITDNEGYLPLDYAIKHKNTKGFKCLMEFGVNVIYTSSFLKLSFAQIMDRSLIEAFLLKHLTKLKAVGFYIDPVYEPYLQRNQWQTYLRACLDEVKELKLCMVDDDMSLYDLLHIKTKYCRYTHLTKLLRNLKSSFPIYYNIIRIRIHEIEKKLLIKPAIMSWYELTNINLPYICVENILSHLNTCCLKTMISSSEDKIVYNSVLLEARWIEEL